MINRDAETDGARSCGGDEPILSLDVLCLFVAPGSRIELEWDVR